MMSDQPGEQLDDDKLGGEYPPERPLGVEEYGTTPAEEEVDEPLEERVAREEPDVLVPADVPGSEHGPLSDDDLVSDDADLRDVATELVAPPPAEEAALHLVDDDDLA